MYQRQLSLEACLARRSVFLLGPRQTGKSTLLRLRYPKALYIDLLEADTFRKLSLAPESLRKKHITDQTKLVIIDEIQKLPELLDEVQLLIDRNKTLRFILTGSSARKLKSAKVNLLGGRAMTTYLHPLVSCEIPQRTLERINKSSLPFIIDSPMPEQDLNTYVGSYLKEEIQAEGLTRNIGNFARVLEVAAATNTQIINFTKIGNDAQVSPRTVKDYFGILSDTLIVHMLEPFQKTKKRKAVATPKLYFFDLGVVRNLRHETSIHEDSPHFGMYLEHMVLLELRAYIDYQMQARTISFWRSLSQLEVDFVVDDELAIEVKATKNISRRDLKGLQALGEDLKHVRKVVVCRDQTHKAENGISIYHYHDFFAALWQGQLF